MTPEYIVYDKNVKTNQKKFKFMLMDLVGKEMFMSSKKSKLQKSRFPFIHIELFEHMRQNRPVRMDIGKENVYSLGLIVLCIAMIFNYKALYYDTHTFDETGKISFNVKLQILKKTID
jgi:hypothetical protein